MKKILAITADDFGPHPHINNGIIRGIEKGVVSAIGVMTNDYWSNVDNYRYNFKTELDRLVNAIDGRDVGIGVHLTLTSGAPLTGNLNLVDAAYVMKEVPFDEEKSRLLFQEIKEYKFLKTATHLQAICEELRAQIKRMKDALDQHGLKIDHISCHQGITGLFQAYHNELLRAINSIYKGVSLNERPTVRSPLPISKLRKYRGIFSKSAMKREGYYRAVKLLDDNKGLRFELLNDTRTVNIKKRVEEFRENGFVVPQFLFDTYYGYPYMKRLNEVFFKFPSGFEFSKGELIVHLAYGNGSNIMLRGINVDYFKKRRAELITLEKFDLERQAIKKNIKIISMGRMFEFIT